MDQDPSPVCQCQCVPQLSLGTIPKMPWNFRIWIKMVIKRNLSHSTKRKLKRFFIKLNHPQKSSSSLKAFTNPQNMSLHAGDLVRVRSEEEILKTLDSWKELKGCMFMDAQRQYCGTVQKVLKSVERFVDERDYRVKKAKGLILLEGLICEGTPDYGRCDRACFYFWREEWLEKI